MEREVLHNADHPIEYEAVDLIIKYLSRARWPFERLPVMVTFGVRTEASQSQIDFDKDAGDSDLLRGKVRIYLNYLFLIKHEGIYLTDTLPHEVAHILTNAASQKMGKEVRDHGPEWTSWLYRLNSDALATCKGKGGFYDFRPIHLHKGGIPIQCDCNSEETFSVLSMKSESKLHDMVCKNCNGKYRKVERDDIPPGIIQDYEFLRNEQSNRRTVQS
jgi:predicted SprT family Zn-dependent metalloprotease